MMSFLPDRQELNVSRETFTPDTINALLHEYDALRAEVLKRIEIMYQISTIALIGPGTLFAFGLQTKNASLILLYPLFSMLLAIMWSNYDRRCRQLGSYIKGQIEARFGEEIMGWEHFMDSSRSKHWFFDWGNLWASLGIFVGTEILALVVGIPMVAATKSGTILPLYLLLATTILSIIITSLRLLWPPRLKKEPKSILMPFANTSRKKV